MNSNAPSTKSISQSKARPPLKVLRYDMSWKEAGEVIDREIEKSRAAREEWLDKYADFFGITRE